MLFSCWYVLFDVLRFTLIGFFIVEFLNATRTEMKLFENFIEKHHVFIDYVILIELC